MNHITFMGKDYLLDTRAARHLYHTYAENAPVLDYHCHISPEDIWLDKKYENITQLWLGVGGSYFGDHYKWRLMRSCGVPEEYITGTAPDEERFCRWAECLERAVGNPLYTWSHLELQTYFGITEPLTAGNAREVYARCNEKLQDLSVRTIIARSKVTLLCTTDDPVDSLEFHKKIAGDTTFAARVLPAWRPDKACHIEKPDFCGYMARLSAVSGVPIATFADLKRALALRMDYFAAVGCTVSDHGIDCPVYHPAGEAEVEEIFARRMAGQTLTADEVDIYHTAFMTFVGREYGRRGWVMQLHYGAKRDNNTACFRTMGADTGFDCINDAAFAAPLSGFLNALALDGMLPRTILYSLNPNDNAAIGTILGCFQDATVAGKVQQGSAWWFNDHFRGMTDQMESLAALGNLSGFVGMLTDSRSFLSYTRHDYFRRILCRLLGRWVEEGTYPDDEAVLGSIVRDICYNNAVRYFNFPLTTC